MNRIGATAFLFLLAMLASTSLRAQDENGELQAVLNEMAEVEGRIGGLGREQSLRRERIGEVDANLSASELTLRDQARAREAGQEKLRESLIDLAARSRTLVSETGRKGQDLGQSRVAVHAATILLHRDTLERRPIDRQTLLVALLAEHHLLQTDMADHELSELERERSDVAKSTEDVRQLMQRHATYAGEGEAALRRRHRELAGTLERLRSRATTEVAKERELEARREELAELVRGLKTKSVAAISPTERAREPVAISPIEDHRDLLAQPISPAKVDFPAEPIQDGARWIFWRATPTDVHSLAAGTVLFNAPHAGYRHLLIVDHGAGWATLYGNLAMSYVIEGETVGVGHALGSYEAAPEDGRAEPFWIEARYDGEEAEVDAVPGAGEGWMARVFGR